MIDINLYRLRIGTHSHQNRKMKFLRKFESLSENSTKAGLQAFLLVKLLLKISLILLMLSYQNSCKSEVGPRPPSYKSTNYMSPQLLMAVQFFYKSKKQTSNYKAKYLNGNKQAVKRGIRSLHLNIRSLGNKVVEVKNIVREHSPHIFGLSECELKKIGGQYDENKLKVPGYSILFPKSWAAHGFARVLVYVKNTLEYEQVSELEDDLVQSVWLKAGFRNSKKVYFCHCYREHTSTLGNTISAQKACLGTLLSQWEAATLHSNPDEPNETHICGDMNLDCHEGKWLRPDYSLLSLSRLVQAASNLCNFTQLVTSPTRAQYNSVRRETDISCIDHVYCNTKYRCSEVSVISFGNSDHDMLSYVRYSKEPPSPARTIRKRSYKNFAKEDFLTELSKIDWAPVYSCQDVDQAEITFTRLFQAVVNVHAPWVQYQQRKRYVPWLTDETKHLMKQRDDWKAVAKQHALENPGEDAGEEQINAWEQYKKFRNRINNRKRTEEINFKRQPGELPSSSWSGSSRDHHINSRLVTSL